MTRDLTTGVDEEIFTDVAGDLNFYLTDDKKTIYSWSKEGEEQIFNESRWTVVKHTNYTEQAELSSSI